MIAVYFTPILLAVCAGVLGWKAGERVRIPAQRLATRLRAACAVLRGRSMLCNTCRSMVSEYGGTVVGCWRCDPLLVALLEQPPTRPTRTRDHRWGWSRDV